MIAGAGLATAIGAESVAEVVARTVIALSPGSSDALLADVVDGRDDEGSERGEIVVALGLATAFLAGTSAFAQLERGANRIYGTKRHRPALRKYGNAALLTATAGVALAVGLLLVVAVTLLFRHAPRRRQPGLSWLGVGASVTVLAWLVGSGLLALYVVAVAGFGDT